VQISRGIESLYNKLRSAFKDSKPEWTGAAECDDCSRLALCAARLEQMSTELAEEPDYRGVHAKLMCTLFQVYMSIIMLKPRTHSLDEYR